MIEESRAALSRRTVLCGAISLAGVGMAPKVAAADVPSQFRTFDLHARPSRVALVGDSSAETSVWAYDSSVPGPEIRVRQGDRVRISVANRLAEETTVHWHGLRVPNAMDGVPHLTQKPIEAGGTFTYEFDVPDAGTYWYHPHQRGYEQVGRGLYGPLIVEERDPIRVDRDVTWVLDDWRLNQDGQISNDFGNRHDMSHNGRVGNTVTVNGRIVDEFVVRRGERVRLRLINAANARIFGLEFNGHRPMIVALDGQAVAPHEPSGGRVVLGPAMRADLVIDMTGPPGSRFAVSDTFYGRLEYRLLEVVYGPKPLREQPLETAIAISANTMPEPLIAHAVRHEVRFNGGMMGGMMMSSGSANMMEMMHSGKIWFINGVAATGHVIDPLLTLAKGSSAILKMQNDTAWHHPIHLHGHSFRVISRNGQATRYREWQDTVLMSPREQIEIAFVADNPGDWMFHCHILEHQAGGMMGVIRVSDDVRRI